MKARLDIDAEMTLAATIAPEDLRVGDDVAILNQTYEYPSFLWECGSSSLPPHAAVRVTFASRDCGAPLRVRAVCLPFVFLETPGDSYCTVDLRLVQLVRLDRGYARLVRKKLRPLGRAGRRKRSAQCVEPDSD